MSLVGGEVPRLAERNAVEDTETVHREAPHRSLAHETISRRLYLPAISPLYLSAMSSACDFTIETMRPAAGAELQSTAT